MKAILFFILFMLNTILGKTQTTCNTPAALAYSFIKSVTVKDSILFYNCIAKSELKERVNKSYGLDRKIREDELHTLYFIKYSPWKIKPEELDRMAKEFDIKSEFYLKTEKPKNDILCLHVEWNDKNRLFLYLRKINSEWKIIDVR